MKFNKLKNVADYISTKASDILSSTTPSKPEINDELTEEEKLAHFERMLSAERAKTERGVKRQKEKVEELTPRGVFSKMFCDKEELEIEIEKLDKLENRLIELNNMNAKDLYLEVKNNGGWSNDAGWSDTKRSVVASILETAGGCVPVPGAPVVSKILGSIIRKD